MTDTDGGGWRPDPGDTITGVVVDLDEGLDRKGDPYPMVTIATDDGAEVVVHAFHRVLQNELAKRQVQLNDEITITYVGPALDDAGAVAYHRYRVRGGSKAPIDWSRYGGPSTPRPDTPPPAGGQPATPPPPAAPQQPPPPPAAEQPEPVEYATDDDRAEIERLLNLVRLPLRQSITAAMEGRDGPQWRDRLTAVGAVKMIGRLNELLADPANRQPQPDPDDPDLPF